MQLKFVGVHGAKLLETYRLCYSYHYSLAKIAVAPKKYRENSPKEGSVKVFKQGSNEVSHLVVQNQPLNEPTSSVPIRGLTGNVQWNILKYLSFTTYFNYFTQFLKNAEQSPSHEQF